MPKARALAKVEQGEQRGEIGGVKILAIVGYQTFVRALERQIVRGG